MKRVIVAIATAVLVATVQAQTGLQDYARGIEIDTPESGAIFRVTLPRDVYATVTRPTLDDLRVFNAAGTPVPITIRRVAPAEAAKETPSSVPIFPMYTEATNAAGTSAQVKLDSSGAVVEVTGRRDAGQSLSSYLVDVTSVREPLVSLSLEWEAREGASFLGHVDVQASDDLNRWRTVVSAAAIAQMRHGAYTITQREIELAPTSARYLRLAWPKELREVMLGRVSVRPQGNAPLVEPNWELVTPAPVPGNVGRASYDVRARLPVERIDLEFADAADAAHVSISSGADELEQLRPRHTGLFYTLREGDTRLANLPAQIPLTTDRFWTVETTRDGGWAGRLPRLKLGWYPQELLFIGQGAGPYTLAYGSGRAGANDAPIDAVLANLDEESRGRVRDAALGEPRDLAGATALALPRSYRREVLWALLIGAVLLLGVFAARLLRTGGSG